MNTIKTYYAQPAENGVQKWRDTLYAFVLYYAVGLVCAIIILVTDSFVVNILHHPSIRLSYFNTNEFIKKWGYTKVCFL